jgi:hypothetical protein
MKMFTREEKKNPKLVSTYEKLVKDGVKPTKAAKLARAEVKN